MNKGYTRGVRFQRQGASADETLTYIGKGDPGGKAAGLATIKNTIASHFHEGRFGDIRVAIPRMTVLLTGIFEDFLLDNSLELEALGTMEDEQIARHFQKAELPAYIVGDLYSLISATHEPLAVRSSSLLEDALHQPLAGVYETKMIPNNQPAADIRFHKLVEAVKFVYASTYFRAARDYFRAVGRDIGEERMAVIIQEVVGYRFGQRYYPTISGVARSYNYYPFGGARPEEGFVSLALGLGKTIVDGGKVWSYSPSRPQAPPPYGSAQEILKNSQTDFWAVSMTAPKEYNPIRETEYLEHADLRQAGSDGTLRHVCSTYDPESDRLVMGESGPGARLADFSPILKGNTIPLNDLITRLLQISEQSLETSVEIEFALAFDLDRARESRFGFLQVRPMLISTEEVDLAQVDHDKTLAISKRTMGNGVLDGLRHVVYVKPKNFGSASTLHIARELERINGNLLQQGISYILIGFGRWGSSDPWLGIPVNWSQISSARVIVETTLPEMNPDLSQGSHFFHNITNLGIIYFSVQVSQGDRIDWEWLSRQPVEDESTHMRHVVSETDLKVVADGRKGEGVIVR
jgi:hypothetical protein